MPRITKKYLANWIGCKLIELGFKGWKVVDVYSTKYNQNDYENGAAKLNIIISQEKYYLSSTTIFCQYRMYELQNYLENGYELDLVPKKIGLTNIVTLSEAYLELKKTI